MLGWALNEEENIAAYIERAQVFLESFCSDYELILLDDGSTDRTLEIAQDYQKTRPWLRVYANEGNRGPGYNTKRAISLAQKDYLFWQTVDWAYDIAQLPQHLHLLEHYDILQGVRVHEDLGRRILRRRSDNSYKALVSIVNYTLIRLLFNIPLNDFQNVTLYPTKLIQSVKLESESSFTNPECLLKTWWQGASIKEIPVPFIKRTKGVAKGTRLRSVIRSIVDIFHWWLIWVVLRRREFKGTGPITPWNQDREA
jgi:glycosyltransferase involved in cell wall biosynthesis